MRRTDLVASLSLGLLVGLLVPALGLAHEVRPAYLELRQTSALEFEMLWKQPLNEGRRLRLDPRIEPACTVLSQDPPEITSLRGSGSVVERFQLDCAPPEKHATSSATSSTAGLSGRRISIEGLERTITDVLVSIERLDGETTRYLLKPARNSFEVDGGQETGVPAYLILGVEHLLFGFDHILFVLGLLFFVRSPWLLVQTITAFTVAHSITLALSTLGLVRLSQGPVEAVIALSILFLAVELLQPPERRSALTRDRPWLFAFTFGLLHGFGFAGALSEIGLPSDAIALALFLFNLGVELGQLLVVAVVLLVLAVARRPLSRLPPVVQRSPIYLMGCLAAAWFVERTIALL